MGVSGEVKLRKGRKVTAGEEESERGGGEDSESDSDEHTERDMCRRCVFVCVCVSKGDMA